MQNQIYPKSFQNLILEKVSNTSKSAKECGGNVMPKGEASILSASQSKWSLIWFMDFDLILLLAGVTLSIIHAFMLLNKKGRDINKQNQNQIY